MSDSSQPNGTRENPQVVEVRGSIPANVQLRIFVVAVAVAVLLPLGVTLGLRWYDQDKRVENIEEVAERNRELVEANFKLQRQLRQFVSDQCVEAESRDVVNVQANLANIKANQAFVLLLTRLVPPGAEVPPATADALADFKASLRDVNQSLRDANLTLEPEGETDCDPGPGGTP